MGLKSHNHQGEHLVNLLNLYTKFQILSSICWSNTRGKFKKFVKGCNEAEKCRPPPHKIHLKLLLNVYTKFQLPSSIWRKVMKEMNSKYKKTRPKKHSFKTVRGCNETEKSELQKIHLGTLYTEFKLLSQIWRGDKRGTVLFQNQKRRKLTYLSSYLIQNTLWWLKKEQFLQFWPFKLSLKFGHY